MNLLLIIIIIIFLVCIIRGWRKGLLRLLFSLVSFIVLIGLVSFATPHISGFLKENTGIYTVIEARCTENIQSRVESGIENSAASTSVAGVSLPESVISYLTGSGESAIASTGVYQEVGSRAADLILAGISFFIALILAIIIVKLIYRALGVVDHIPVIKGINRVLGLFGGAVEAYVAVSLLFLFFALIAGTEAGGAVTGYIDESTFLSWLYYDNILLKAFSVFSF